ncbi:hypothetical protein P280DRAFT_464703 [Massarina eburnea CBS 473.64]|uniref:Uncharacterized protein n=1 Tax=Massarina eburnea CBS 473.64 TaxID=1395130 RepID=A0A6A6SF69_9PLEO|nr:hypothetical protein P280DRAFT_464703 [Massarina eburnea CBS 473.64]
MTVDELEDPIPTYTEATATSASPAYLPPIPTIQSSYAALQPALPVDEPPAYAVLDAAQTTFSLHGTFVHTSNGPAYQISSPLTTRGPYLRIRRLRRKELQRHTPIAFDKENILYEVNDPPLLDSEWHVMGKRRGCLPGVLMMKWRAFPGRGKWRVRQVLRPGDSGEEILCCKLAKVPRSSKSPSSPLSPNAGSPAQLHMCTWTTRAKEVIATETLRVNDDGTMVPVLELKDGLEQKWRELLITVWLTRLWVAIGEEKTKELGDGRRLVRHGGCGTRRRGSLLGLGSLAMGNAGR